MQVNNGHQEKKILELKNLYAGYNGDTILENINLTVYEKDFIGVIGANGSGKTTLLKVILGLIQPYQGSITFFIEGEEHKRQFIGYMPQVSMFDKKFPIQVMDVVGSGLIAKMGLFKTFNKTQKEQIHQVMEQMGIINLRSKPIGELSGGQMQRVFLARALVSSPSLLILDEPETSVDKTFEHGFFNTLKELNKTLTIILVSHDIGMISSYVKTIACISRTLHYHRSNKISKELLDSYHCPIDLITHGHLPHRVLKNHDNHVIKDKKSIEKP
jgi:zinc transport system ATP-binding protein